jgi:elongation factor Ts
MAVSASMVKELRDRTGLGMMECKKALNESNGDIDLAIEELRKSSGMKAAKKAGRTAADGVVTTKVAEDGSYGVVVEVNSELTSLRVSQVSLPLRHWLLIKCSPVKKLILLC